MNMGTGAARGGGGGARAGGAPAAGPPPGVDAAALAAGGIFQQKFLDLVSKCGVLRFMDTQSNNNTGMAHWADRKPVTYYNYSTHYWPPSLVTTNQATNGGSGNTYTLVRPGFTLTDKAQVICRFQQAQTAPGTLNVNGTGAKTIGDVQGYIRSTPGVADGVYPDTYCYCIYDQSLAMWLVFNDYQSGWGLANGTPPEICLEMAIQAGAHPWFNIPYLSCDWGTGQLPTTGDYVTQLATYVRDHQPSWMVPRYETSNESWNIGPGFFSSRYGQNKQYVRNGAENVDQWTATQGAIAFKQISTVYGGDRSKYQTIMGFNAFTRVPERLTASYYVSQGGEAASAWTTHLCYASYFNSRYFITPAMMTMAYRWDQAVGTTAKNAVLDEYVAGCVVAYDGLLLQGGYSLPQFYTQVDAFATFADTYDVGVTFYEGGYSPDDIDSGCYLSITSIDKGATTVLHVASGSLHAKPSLDAAYPGMSMLITGVSGLTALNGNSYTVQSATPSTVTLNVDSSGMSGTASGGAMTYNNVNLVTPMHRASKTRPLVATYEAQNFDYLHASGATFPSEYVMSANTAFGIWATGTYEAVTPPRWQAIENEGLGEPEPPATIAMSRPRIRLR